MKGERQEAEDDKQGRGHRGQRIWDSEGSWGGQFGRRLRRAGACFLDWNGLGVAGPRRGARAVPFSMDALGSG